MHSLCIPNKISVCQNLNLSLSLPLSCMYTPVCGCTHMFQRGHWGPTLSVVYPLEIECLNKFGTQLVYSINPLDSIPHDTRL